MLKNALLLVGLSSCLFVTSQTSIEDELIAVETLEQTKIYLNSKAPKTGSIVTFNENKHKTLLASDLFKLPVGGVKVKTDEFEKTIYKIIERIEKTYYRAAYIYLDGNQSDLSEINALRNKIITLFESGVSFNFLARRYSMDKNAPKGGDLGWFCSNAKNLSIETEVINSSHELNDIYTLDISSENGYYVILKTHEPKDILEINVLKLLEEKS